VPSSGGGRGAEQRGGEREGEQRGYEREGRGGKAVKRCRQRYRIMSSNFHLIHNDH